MRILYLSYYYLPHVGGGTWTTYNLSMRLAKKGHDVQLLVPNIKHKLAISPKESQNLEKNNLSKIHKVPRIMIPRLSGPLISNFFIFPTALKIGRKADIVISQHHPHHFFAVMAVFLGRILGAPVLIRADDVYREMGVSFGLTGQLVKAANRINENFIKYSDRFLVTTSEGEKEISARVNLPPNHIGLSPNGVDPSEFNIVRHHQTNTRKPLGIKSDSKILLFVGRFSGPEYGIDLLLGSLPKIIKEIPDLTLILVGDKLTSRSNALVDSLGIRKNVMVYGPCPRDRIIDLILAADVCVGPLKATRASPMKILEYMTCGKPIVTGLFSVSKDVAVNGTNCVFVPQDSKGIAETIIKLLEDRDYSNRLGLNAKKTADRFSWDRIADDLDVVISDVAKKSRAPALYQNTVSDNYVVTDPSRICVPKFPFFKRSRVGSRLLNNASGVPKHITIHRRSKARSTRYLQTNLETGMHAKDARFSEGS